MSIYTVCPCTLYLHQHVQLSCTPIQCIHGFHRNKDAHKKKDDAGYTPLLLAAECGSTQAFEVLLQHIYAVRQEQVYSINNIANLKR